MPFPSGPRSGKHGLVRKDGSTVISAVRNWSINHTQTPEDQVHSGTLGGHDRQNGFYDWSGTMEGFGGWPLLFPGNTFNFTGFQGPDNGVYGANGNAVIGDAIVDSLSIMWNFQPGGSLSWNIGFSANGCLDETNVADIVDLPDFCIPRMCNLVLQYKEECAGDLTSFANVQSATLNFTAANLPFQNSDTECCTYRRPGNIDWTFELVDQENYSPFVSGNWFELNLYVDPTAYWILKWGLFTGISNLNVNIETGDIITKQYNFAMKGFSCCVDCSPETGIITTPDVCGIGTEDVWPVAAYV